MTKLLPATVLGLALALSARAQAQTAATAPPDSEAPASPQAEPAPEQPAPTATEAAPTATPAEGSRRSVPAAFSPYRSLSDEELAYEYEHNSLGGPVALTVVGGSVSALALPTFLFSGIGALVCHANQELGDCTAIDTVAAVSGISTAVFGTMTIVGVVWLANRSQTRTALKNEMWRRQSESQAEGASLTLGIRPTYGGSMLTVGGRF